MTTTDKLKDVFQYLLAFAIIVGWFVMFYRLFVSPIPVDNMRLADTMFGVLSTVAVMVSSYFFGSNKESAAKTKMLYNSTANPEKPPITTADKTTTTTETTTAVAEPVVEPIPADPIAT